MTRLQLSVFDNNISGTVPTSFTSLSWLAAAYNPGLYGTWPYNSGSGLGVAPQSYVNSTGVYGTTLTAPTGTGCAYGTSLGLSAPLYTILQTAAQALDPSGALLPSWRSGLQPCPPYVGQNSSSPVSGKSWAGVVCQDASSCSASNMNSGGVSKLTLNGLGLNGTLACGVSQLSTATSINLSNNTLTGYIPSSFGRLSPLFSLTSLTALYLGGNQLVGSLPWTFGA